MLDIQLSFGILFYFLVPSLFYRETIIWRKNVRLRSFLRLTSTRVLHKRVKTIGKKNLSLFATRPVEGTN